MHSHVNERLRRGIRRGVADRMAQYPRGAQAPDTGHPRGEMQRSDDYRLMVQVQPIADPADGCAIRMAVANWSSFIQGEPWTVWKV